MVSVRPSSYGSSQEVAKHERKRSAQVSRLLSYTVVSLLFSFCSANQVLFPA